MQSMRLVQAKVEVVPVRTNHIVRKREDEQTDLRLHLQLWAWTLNFHHLRSW